MSKKHNSRKSKPKSKSPKQIIRTDVWQLAVSSAVKAQMLATVEEYRFYLRPLVVLVNAQWTRLAAMTAACRVNAVEKMIHATAKNPAPKHSYFHKIIAKRSSLRKFPSYLRRAAIADAIGIVSSFQTRYRDWQAGIRFKRCAKPPTLTSMCKSYPALYKGQQVLYFDNATRVSLKVWNGTDWVWTDEIKVKSHGRCRHLISGNVTQSPAKRG